MNRRGFFRSLLGLAGAVVGSKLMPQAPKAVKRNFASGEISTEFRVPFTFNPTDSYVMTSTAPLEYIAVGPNHAPMKVTYLADQQMWGWSTVTFHSDDGRLS